MKRILPLLLAFALAAPSARAAVYTSELSFPSAPAAALADFPVLVRISATTPSGFSYANCPDASHLWFTDDGGASLPFEVDTWDTNGTSLAWVSVPALSNSATIAMHWADDTANVPDDIPASREVWTRAGYNAVWHFAGSATESVTNLAATAAGSPSYNGNTSYPGPLGKTLWLDGSSYLSVANDPGWATVGENSTLTISCWARATASGYSRMISSMSNWNNPAGYELTLQNSYTQITVGSSGKSQFQTDIATGPNAEWKYFTATYAGTTATLYVDGASAKSATLNPVVAPTEILALGSASGTKGANLWNGGLDEVRIRAAASTAAWVAAEYATMTDATYVACSAAATDPTAPAVATPVVTRGANGTFTVAAEVSANVPASIVCVADGAVTNAMATADAALPMTYSAALAGLAADTTYVCTVEATSTGGTVVKKPCPTTFYNGDLSVSKVSDANMTGLVPGSFRISRADTAHDLVVEYTVGGTATPGRAYTALSGSATIPAGANSVDIPVVPLFDVQTTSNTTVTVTLAAGLYGVDANAETATLSIGGYRPVQPTDFAWKTTATPSAAALATIGDSVWPDFPVLLRLPADVSAKLLAANGADLLVEDENHAPLSFEVDTFDPSGTTLVWVKVPSFSSATELTVYFGGAANLDNDPTAVWTDYTGVWHMSEASGAVADATGHGLAASPANSTSVSVAHAGGKIGTARQTATSSKKDYLTIPNYDSQNVGANFTFSCWYDATARPGYDRLVSRKRSYGDSNGWEVEMASSNTKLSARGASSTSVSAMIPDLVSSGWQLFTFAYAGSSLTIYLDGVQVGSGSITAATDNGYPLSIGCDSDGSEANFVGYVDEARLRKGAASAAAVALEHATMADPAFFDYEDVASADPTATVFETPTAVRNANGSYSVTVVLAENTGDVGVVYDAGAAAVTNIIQYAATPGTYTDTPANLAADTTYAFAAYGRNASDTEVVKKGGVFYTGDLSVAKVSDAAENGLVPGVFRISRADTAHDLTVAYTVGGTAIADQTYVALSGTATIPAGSSSVDIAVAPLLDTQTTSNATVSVTLAAGLYGVSQQAGSAELTIANLAAPAGYNTWIAVADGLASVGSNWSEGHAPTAGENVLLDGRFSTKNCEWDAAASATVASWTQTNGYTGTVTFDTEFPDYAGATFPLFTISGDCAIASGNWSCRGNYNNFGVVTADWMNTSATAKRWCLNVSVGGDLEIASGASVTVTGRGYGYPSSNTGASPAYGGWAHGGATAPYGSITEPFDPGRGALAQGDQRRKVSAIGGGAVKLAVAGTLAVDGSIVAVGTTDLNTVRSGGSGGSIWIAANQISGSGTIDASACPPSQLYSDLAVSTGSGGRIALYTQSPLAFPMANVSCNGTAYQGKGWNSGSKVGGPGTIYVKDPTQAHGTLYVKQSRDIATLANKWTGTPVMGDLALDAVVLSGNAQLRIPEGTSLTLPSLSAVTTDNDTAGISGIICAGGTLNIGNGNQTLKANVAFSSPTPFTFPADLTLETGARLGALNGIFSPAAGQFDTNFTVTVAGDLVIPSGAEAGATRCCSALLSGTTTRGVHGGSSLYDATTATNAYDSVLNPSKTGSSTTYGFRAGGVFNLTVGGTLSLDGTISADGFDTRGNGNTWAGAPAGSAGSLNLRLGALSGSGAITAQGGSGAPNYAGGAGGGRVAVRLTGRGSTFSDHWKANVTAYGVSFSATKNGKASSAGTVYLQEATNAESAGLVLIRNDLALQAGAVSNLCATPYPGRGAGCDAPNALKRTSLLVAGAARVALTDSLRSANLDMDAGTTLDLAGHEFTVTTAHVGGENVEPGIYTAAQMQARGFDEVVDTADGAGGTLRILGAGTVLILR